LTDRHTSLFNLAQGVFPCHLFLLHRFRPRLLFAQHSTALKPATDTPPPNVRETPVELAKLARRARHSACGPTQPGNNHGKHRLALARGLTAKMETDVVPPGPANTEYGKAARAATGVFSALTQGLTREEVMLGTPSEKHKDENGQSQYSRLPSEWQSAIAADNRKKLKQPAERLKRDQDYVLCEDDAVRLLLNSALRYMRLSGPHSQLPAQAMAPMHMRREVTSGVAGYVAKNKNSNDPRVVKEMMVNSFFSPNSCSIAHEAVHEKQHSYKKSTPIEHSASGARETTENETVDARKNLHLAAKHTIPTTRYFRLQTNNRYLTQPWEVLAFSEEAAVQQHAWMGDIEAIDKNPIQFGSQEKNIILFGGKYNTLSALIRKMRRIAGDLFDKPTVYQQSRLFHSGKKDGDCMDYVSEFKKSQLEAFKITSQILLRMADIEKYQQSEMGEQVSAVVHAAVKKLVGIEEDVAIDKENATEDSDSMPEVKDYFESSTPSSDEDTPASAHKTSSEKAAEKETPAQGLQSILNTLNEVISDLRAEHGARLLVPANTTAMVEDEIHFDAAHQNPLGHAKIIGQEYTDGDDLAIEIIPEHVDTALAESGFAEANSALQVLIKEGREIPHEAILEPIMKLANYLYGDVKKKIPPPALNVYEAPNREIPVVEGLTTASQPRKLRFDIASWQVHIPKHILQEPQKLAGRLAKVAIDMAMAASAMRSMHPSWDSIENKGMVDPGSTSQAIQTQLQPSKRERKADDHLSIKNMARSEIENDNKTQVLLSSLIGTSKTYEFSGSGIWRGSFKGAQKPTPENHWHHFGDRVMLKEMKDSPAQSPANREHAALAYRAGVMARKEAQPLLAVRRAFALQANAISNKE
jgi:hypothetical protein